MFEIKGSKRKNLYNILLSNFKGGGKMEKRSAWVITCREGNCNQEAIKKGLIGIGWSYLGDLSKMTPEQIKNKLIEIDEKYLEINTPIYRNIYDFANTMKKGDIVILRNGLKKIEAIGIVKSDYKKLDEGFCEDLVHVREVEWKRIEDIYLERGQFSRFTIIDIELDDERISKFIKEFL